MGKKLKKKRVVTKKKTTKKKKAKPAATDQDAAGAVQRGPAPRDTSKGHIGGGVKTVRAQKHQSR